MPEAYNPIVRTFCQFRAGLTTSLGVARHDVRPGTPLDALLPIGRRREVWRQLRRQGLRLPSLELSERDRLCNLWVVLAVSVAAGSSAFYSQNGYVLLFAIPLALFVYWASRRRAVHFPLGLRTVGEMVIHAMRFSDHEDSGYRWTRSEIALKVRMTVAESAGLPLEAIQPETRLLDLWPARRGA